MKLNDILTENVHKPQFAFDTHEDEKGRTVVLVVTKSTNGPDMEYMRDFSRLEWMAKADYRSDALDQLRHESPTDEHKALYNTELEIHKLAKLVKRLETVSGGEVKRNFKASKIKLIFADGSSEIEAADAAKKLLALFVQHREILEKVKIWEQAQAEEANKEYRKKRGAERRNNRAELENLYGRDVVRRVTARKYEGDDKYSWAVFIDGRPWAIGMTQSLVDHYKQAAYKHLSGVKMDLYKLHDDPSSLPGAGKSLRAKRK